MADIRLIPALPTHAEAVFRWRQQSSTVQHNASIPASLGKVGERLAAFGRDLGDQSAKEHGWMLEWSDEVIGLAVLNELNWRNGHGEIGYMLAESHHGRGLGTACVKAVVGKIFQESALNRLIATTSVENDASWRILEKLGWTREGTLREHTIIEGRAVDQYIYGLLRRDWRGPR